MKIYVVRHCSNDCSEKKIFCGETDLPLSPLGEREAEELRKRAETLTFDFIFSSPFLRAMQTAEALSRGKTPILPEYRLREREFGSFEGTGCSRPDGEMYRRNIALKYPGGESYLDVAARIFPLLNEITECFAGKRLCIVSHGSACRVIRAYFKEMTDEEFYSYSQPNGTIEEYEYNGKTLFE